jgi:hypothetical protein
MPARDFYFDYYTGKLWDCIPPIYREEDGLASPRGVLRAIVEIVAEQMAVARRSTDRLWEDAFIERCDDWAVPYIGDLLATRMVSALNTRARRVDVAKTIYYRRRIGTPRVLEELIADMTGWDGVLVEMFRRLGRFRHGLDPDPEPLAGRFTATPPGGWADLRNARGAQLAGTPFDEFLSTPDVRRHRGTRGRHAIPKLAFRLYRLPVLELRDVSPGPGADAQSWTFDPSGRDVPLFMPRNRPDDWEEWRSALEWELPAPLNCRLLNHAEFVITEALILDLIATAGLNAAAANDLRTMRGLRLRSEAQLRRHLASLPNQAQIFAPAVIDPLIRGAMVEDCGKRALLPLAASAQRALRVELPAGNELDPAQIAGTDLENWSVPAGLAPDKDALADPERGRLFAVAGPPDGAPLVSYWYAFPGPAGAGAYDRAAFLVSPVTVSFANGAAIPAGGIPGSGVVQFEDNRTWTGLPDVSDVSQLVIQAEDRRRPYLLLNADWVLDTGANTESVLTLEGLWIGASGAHRIVLQGDYERVIVRHCTLDPGGESATGAAINPVPLVIEGNVEELVVENSITASIATAGAGLLDRLTAHDSVLHSLLLPAGYADLARVTVFGGADLNRLDATEVLITGLADVTNTQAGCFRFSAAAEGSRVPHPYESHFFTDNNHFFTSRRFGQPGYSQLSETAPLFLLRGAENGSEIGAWSGLINPIKADSLRAKVDEFAPFGRIPIYINET